MSSPPRVLVLGAHPDDAEYAAGGLASLMVEAGHIVKFVSVTDGAAGHHFRPPNELRAIRRREARAAGTVLGIPYAVWNNPDGHLLPTLDVRIQILRELRTFVPDLVLTHRPCDYHPDHRAVGQAVQDASYLVTVPRVVPEVPALRKDPIVAYMTDLFTRPNPLRADLVLDVTDRIETILSMLACHASQMFEWLPYNERRENELPAEVTAGDETARRRWAPLVRRARASSRRPFSCRLDRPLRRGPRQPGRIRRSL